MKKKPTPEKEFELKLDKLKLHKNLYEQYTHTGSSIDCLNKLLSEKPKHRIEIKFTPTKENSLPNNLILDTSINNACILSLLQVLDNYRNTLKASISVLVDVEIITNPIRKRGKDIKARKLRQFDTRLPSKDYAVKAKDRK